MITKDSAPNRGMETRKKRVRSDATGHGEKGANSLRLFAPISLSTSGSIFTGFLTGNQGSARQRFSAFHERVSVHKPDSRKICRRNIGGRQQAILSSGGWP